MIPQSPLEKVAMALHACATENIGTDNPTWETEFPEVKAQVRMLARSAVTALLDPDEGTVEVMLFRGSAKQVFVDAIQHILKGAEG